MEAEEQQIYIYIYRRGGALEWPTTTQGKQYTACKQVIALRQPTTACVFADPPSLLVRRCVRLVRVTLSSSPFPFTGLGTP